MEHLLDIAKLYSIDTTVEFLSNYGSPCARIICRDNKFEVKTERIIPLYTNMESSLAKIVNAYVDDMIGPMLQQRH